MSALAVAPSPASLFATVAIAHALAVISPGPDFAIVTRQTLAHGRAAGVRTALGVATGICVHVAYSLFGLSWVIQELPALVLVLHLGGGLLLLWIGWNAVRVRPTDTGTEPAAPAQASARDFAVGFATNALNVKAMLFFVALCSAVVTGATPTLLKLALGGWMVLATGAWFCFVAWTLGHPRVRERLFRNSHWIDRLMGTILMLLGAGMLLGGLQA